MKIDIPGKMQDFSAVNPGDLFSYFTEGSQHWGMLSRTEAGELGPVSFTEPIQQGWATPCQHELSQFQNRSVLVIGGAEARAIWPQAFRDGSPHPSDGIGALIVAENSTMVRVKGLSGLWDIAVTNGHAQTAKAHAGSLTIPKWEIGFVQESFQADTAVPKAVDSKGVGAINGTVTLTVCEGSHCARSTPKNVRRDLARLGYG